MDLVQIMEIIGELAGDGETQYEAAAKAQCALVEHMLRPDLTEAELESYSFPLNYLCALRAISAVGASEGLTSPLEIKAGEVSVKNSFSRQEISGCIEEFELCLAPVFKDGFVFRAMEFE